MKKLIFVTVLSAFFVLSSASISMAGCSKCAESHAKAEKMKPCEKCIKADKPCKCGKKAKEPCEKVIGEKPPCQKCAESERTSHAKNKPTVIKGSNLGSLHMQSRGNVYSGFNE